MPRLSAILKGPIKLQILHPSAIINKITPRGMKTNGSYLVRANVSVGTETQNMSSLVGPKAYKTAKAYISIMSSKTTKTNETTINYQ